MTTGQSMVDLPHARIAGGPRTLVVFEAPTLVVAGSRDFFFPEPIVDETAERIPQATLRRYDGVGHAVSKTHKRRFEDDVLSFLRG